jgi:hypothetical protein
LDRKYKDAGMDPCRFRRRGFINKFSPSIVTKKANA